MTLETGRSHPPPVSGEPGRNGFDVNSVETGAGSDPTERVKRTTKPDSLPGVAVKRYSFLGPRLRGPQPSKPKPTNKVTPWRILPVSPRCPRRKSFVAPQSIHRQRQ